jgi:hypothetical protein
MVFFGSGVERGMRLKMKTLMGTVVISTPDAADFSNNPFHKKTTVNSNQSLN